MESHTSGAVTRHYGSSPKRAACRRYCSRHCAVHHETIPGTLGRKKGRLGLNWANIRLSPDDMGSVPSQCEHSLERRGIRQKADRHRAANLETSPDGASGSDGGLSVPRRRWTFSRAHTCVCHSPILLSRPAGERTFERLTRAAPHAAARTVTEMQICRPRSMP